MRTVIFTATDRETNKPIDLYSIRISTHGEILAVTDIAGEMYGLHQVSLELNGEEIQ